jgi:hypothetical protein
MVKFDLNRFDGAFAIGFLGGTIGTALCQMTCVLVSRISDNLLIIEALLNVAFYILLTEILVFITAIALLLINAKRAEEGVAPGASRRVLIILIMTGVIIAISLIVPQFIPQSV